MVGDTQKILLHPHPHEHIEEQRHVPGRGRGLTAEQLPGAGIRHPGQVGFTRFHEEVAHLVALRAGVGGVANQFGLGRVGAVQQHLHRVVAVEEGVIDVILTGFPSGRVQGNLAGGRPVGGIGEQRRSPRRIPRLRRPPADAEARQQHRLGRGGPFIVGHRPVAVQGVQGQASLVGAPVVEIHQGAGAVRYQQIPGLRRGAGAEERQDGQGGQDVALGLPDTRRRHRRGHPPLRQPVLQRNDKAQLLKGIDQG